MTWTYTNDPANVERDALRLEIGDTDTSDQLLSDEELDHLLAREGSVFAAAVNAARVLMAKFARLVDKSVGDLKLSYSQRRDAYKALVDQLQERRRLSGGTGLIVGGISRSRKQTVEQDTDRVSPDFSRDRFRRRGHADHHDLDDICD